MLGDATWVGVASKLLMAIDTGSREVCKQSKEQLFKTGIKAVTPALPLFGRVLLVS